MKQIETKASNSQIRSLSTDEVNAVAGGTFNNPFNSALAWRLIARGDAWLASVGVDSAPGGNGQK